MKRSRTRAITTVALMAVVAATAPSGAASSAPPARPSTTDLPARELRSIYTSEFGVDRPTGVTYKPGTRALLVAGPRAAGGSKLVELTPTEDRLGTLVRSGLDDADNTAFNPRTKQLVTGDPERLAEVSDARGSTYSPDGTRHVLDAASDSIVSVAPAGAVTDQPLRGLDGADLRGIAYNPQDGLLYVAAADASTLYAVDDSGEVVATHDMSGAEIASLESMTFAPSADPTDDPETQSLYVADSGDEETLGRIAEVTTQAEIVAMANVDADLVATSNLWQLTPPSPDSAGIAFIPGQDRLMVTDSEVNEIPGLYADVNMFTLQRSGSMTGGGTTLPWSNEPTGTAFGNGMLYTTDDDKKQIFEIPGAGADGVFGTSDDPANRTFKTTTIGNTDPEGIAYDSKRGHLLIVDGVGSEVFRLEPGPNGTFQGGVAGSDDAWSQFDMTIHGAEDPEGIEYDAVRDTIAVLDGSSEAIYELDENGSLLNVISVTAASPVNAAGLAIAPASSGSGRHYYLVDRGLDNNSHPGENDGMMYEMSAELAPITNRPPAAKAGPDLMGDVGEVLNLNGSGVDDGNPSNSLTYQWSMVSGTGTVTFGTPAAATTTATFSAAGTYVLRLTVDDSALTGFDDVTVNVFEPGAPRAISIPIAASSDDANEGGGTNGDFVDLTGPDLELGNDGTPADNPDQMIGGLRFSIPVPQGGEILSAKVQFRVDEPGSAAASYTVRAQAADNAPTFAAVRGNISSRTLGSESVAWSPPAWPTIGEAGAAQLTPELKSVVQPVVNRLGWTKDNGLVLVIDGAPGTGRRTAEAKDGLGVPVLQLEYRPLPANTAPVANAGPDRTVARSAGVNLTGTVTDDGQPLPVALTHSWSKVSGPGDVTFGDAQLQATTASFSAAGTYVLRLTASDGALTHTDDVTITVVDELAITLQSSRLKLVAGGQVKLTGRLTTTSGTPLAGATVQLRAKRAPSTVERRLRAVTTGARGWFSTTDSPKVISRYVAVHAGQRSTVRRVVVRPKLTAAFGVSSVRVGSRVRVSGVLSPSAARTPVLLQRWNGSRWRTVQRTTRPARASVGYGFTVRHTKSGTWRYRVVVPAYAGRARSVAPGAKRGLVLKVFAASITRVQPLRSEFVVVRNTGRVGFNLADWRLRNAWTGRKAQLPRFHLPVGARVRIYTGNGRTTKRYLFLGKRQMWGASGGVVVLRSARALRVDRMSY